MITNGHRRAIEELKKELSRLENELGELDLRNPSTWNEAARLDREIEDLRRQIQSEERAEDIESRAQRCYLVRIEGLTKEAWEGIPGKPEDAGEGRFWAFTGATVGPWGDLVRSHDLPRVDTYKPLAEARGRRLWVRDVLGEKDRGSWRQVTPAELVRLVRNRAVKEHEPEPCGCCFREVWRCDPFVEVFLEEGDDE